MRQRCRTLTALFSDRQKWEASWQGRPPTALGDLGDLDGVLVFRMRVELLNAQSTSQAAGQATWPPDHLARAECQLRHPVADG